MQSSWEHLTDHQEEMPDKGFLPVVMARSRVKEEKEDEETKPR